MFVLLSGSPLPSVAPAPRRFPSSHRTGFQLFLCNYHNFINRLVLSTTTTSQTRARHHKLRRRQLRLTPLTGRQWFRWANKTRRHLAIVARAGRVCCQRQCWPALPHSPRSRAPRLMNTEGSVERRHQVAAVQSAPLASPSATLAPG